jgi:hypothetical protein
MELSCLETPLKAHGHFPLHPSANRHTSIPDLKKLRHRSSSEIGYDLRDTQSGRYYAHVPPVSHFGPHFERRPLQEEFLNNRETKEIWYSEKVLDKLSFREEYCHYSHSFHEPIQQHQYSNPYERRPKEWTTLMETEHGEYYRVSNMRQNWKELVGQAKATPLGRKHTPNMVHGKEIKDGISHARAGRSQANW